MLSGQGHRGSGLAEARILCARLGEGPPVMPVEPGMESSAQGLDGLGGVAWVG